MDVIDFLKFADRTTLELWSLKPEGVRLVRVFIDLHAKNPDSLSVDDFMESILRNHATMRYDQARWPSDAPGTAYFVLGKHLTRGGIDKILELDESLFRLVARVAK